MNSKSVDEVLIEAYSDFNNSGCSVNFLLPNEAKSMDLRLIRCFPNIVSKYVFSKQFPNSNRTEWCEDGPLMPYLEGSWFRNFYCSMRDNPQSFCGDIGFYRDTFTGKGYHRSIIILFGENAASVSRSAGTNEVHQEACLSVNNRKVGQFA